MMWKEKHVHIYPHMLANKKEILVLQQALITDSDARLMRDLRPQ